MYLFIFIGAFQRGGYDEGGDAEHGGTDGIRGRSHTHQDARQEGVRILIVMRIRYHPYVVSFNYYA